MHLRLNIFNLILHLYNIYINIYNYILNYTYNYIYLYNYYFYFALKNNILVIWHITRDSVCDNSANFSSKRWYIGKLIFKNNMVHNIITALRKSISDFSNFHFVLPDSIHELVGYI